MALDRSQQMARIRRKDTGPELRLRRQLWAEGLRYRKDFQTGFGRADICFVRARVTIFIDGRFWHGCPEHYVRPRSRGDFWADKLTTNVERDRRQTLGLESCGWRVLRFWEHEVYEALADVVMAVRSALGAVGSGFRQPEDDDRVVRVEPEGDDGQERRYFASLRHPERCSTRLGPRITAKWRRGQNG